MGAGSLHCFPDLQLPLFFRIIATSSSGVVENQRWVGSFLKAPSAPCWQHKCSWVSWAERPNYLLKVGAKKSMQGQSSNHQPGAFSCQLIINPSQGAPLLTSYQIWDWPLLFVYSWKTTYNSSQSQTSRSITQNGQHWSFPTICKSLMGKWSWPGQVRVEIPLQQWEAGSYHVSSGH